MMTGEQPPIPRGVTHGDELLYLFSTGVFNFSEEDWDLSWKMVNLWTNFVIYGYVVSAHVHRMVGPGFESRPGTLGVPSLSLQL